MEKLRRRKGYYKGCFTDIDSKIWVLGEVLTLKEVLDQWWNSVRCYDIEVGERNLCCYKTAYTCDPAYVDFEGNPVSKKLLKTYVRVDDEYDEDSDGYPIVRVRLATPEEIEREVR